MEDFIVSLVIFTSIYAVFGLGLNMQWGFTGLINFGHVAFMTLGSYTTVLLSQAGVPLVLAAIGGGCVAAGLGLLIGVSTLRLRTDYLAIVTIGVAEVIRSIAVNEEWLTGGTFGIQRFPLPLQGFNPSFLTRIGMIVVLTVVVGLAYFQLWQWLRQHLKRVSLAVLGRGSLVALVYLGTLTLLLVAIATASQTLKRAELLPPWVLGLALLGAIVAVCWGYLTLAKRVQFRVEGWSPGLMLISTLFCALVGIWIFGYMVSAIYNYSNPTKTGLMWVSVLMVALLYAALQRLVRSPWGRVLKAIREDEEVAKALGKNVFWYKLQSLMVGGLCAGIAGSLYAWQLTTVFPDNFLPLITFNAWTIVMLGGAGSNVGTLMGAAIFWGYDSITRFILRDIVPLDDVSLGAFRVMIIGLILMGLMVWRPQGILGKKEELSLGR